MEQLTPSQSAQSKYLPVEQYDEVSGHRTVRMIALDTRNANIHCEETRHEWAFGCDICQCKKWEIFGPTIRLVDENVQRP